MRFFITLLLFLTLSHPSESGVQEELELFPGSPLKTVKLPFPYHHLKEDERMHGVWVIERLYTVLSDDSPAFAIVGMLQPCIFVGLRNAETNKAVIFHKHFSNSLDSLISIAKEELGVQDPQNLTGVLFTNNCISYDTACKHLNGGLSQVDTLKLIKDRIIQEFQIADRTQIKASKFTTSLKDYELGDYEFAELSVSVDSQLHLRSICLMHEKVGCDFSILPNFRLRTGAFGNFYRQKVEESFLRHFPDNLDDINSYAVLPFKKADEKA